VNGPRFPDALPDWPYQTGGFYYDPWTRQVTRTGEQAARNFSFGEEANTSNPACPGPGLDELDAKREGRR
jgi:hypothetical protein